MLASLRKIQSAIRERIQRRINKWVFQLRPAEQGEVYLKQRRVFIVPTRAGFVFFALLVTLFIGSINYNLSLGFAFTFLLAGCGLVDMHLTFRNMAFLHLAPGRAAAVFCGEEAVYELVVHNRRRNARYAIWVGFIGPGLPEIEHPIDVPAQGQTTFTLATHAGKRGWLMAPRIRLQTRFPLGLLRSWAYWSPDLRALVYPHPEDQAPPLPMHALPDDSGSGSAGQDDFAGVRAYQAGDSLRQLAWRQIARLDGDTLVSKQFEGGAASELVLDFGALPHDMDVEARLSRMTRWVLDAEARGLPYAFRLGAHYFPPTLGPAHQAACLAALALYGVDA